MSWHGSHAAGSICLCGSHVCQQSELHAGSLAQEQEYARLARDAVRESQESAAKGWTADQAHTWAHTEHREARQALVPSARSLAAASEHDGAQRIPESGDEDPESGDEDIVGLVEAAEVSKPKDTMLTWWQVQPCLFQLGEPLQHCCSRRYVAWTLGHTHVLM